MPVNAESAVMRPAPVQQPLTAKRRYLSDVTRPVRVVRGELLLGEIEVVFRDPALDAVVVLMQDERSAGLLNRRRYNSALTGRLGYGRAVHIRRPIAEITDWEPLILTPQSSITDAATRAMARPAERKYDEIVVAGTQWGIADFGDVVDSLISALTFQSSRDQLTGMPTRLAAVRNIEQRCQRARGAKARIVVILIHVNNVDDINRRYGLVGGDAVIQAVGQQLIEQQIPGREVARVAGATFAVLVTLPDGDELHVANQVEQIRLDLLAALSVPARGVPANVWPTFSFGVAWTGDTVSTADDLMTVAQQALDSSRIR